MCTLPKPPVVATGSYVTLTVSAGTPETQQTFQIALPSDKTKTYNWTINLNGASASGSGVGGTNAQIIKANSTQGESGRSYSHSNAGMANNCHPAKATLLPEVSNGRCSSSTSHTSGRCISLGNHSGIPLAKDYGTTCLSPSEGREEGFAGSTGIAQHSTAASAQ